MGLPQARKGAESTDAVSTGTRRTGAPKAPPLSVVLFVLYASVFAVCAFAYDGLTDPSGHVLGRDFAVFWTVAGAALDGRAEEIYVPGGYLALAAEWLGPDYPFHTFSYPPTMLAALAPLGTIGYVPALIAWTTLGLGAAALGAGGIRALVAPAVFLNAVLGQTGALLGACFASGAGVLTTRPVLAGVLFGLLAMKPHLALFVPVALIAARAWITLGTGALTVFGLVAVSVLLYGTGPWMDWVTHASALQTQFMLYGTGPFQALSTSMFMAARLAGLAPEHALALQIPWTAGAAFIVWRAYRAARPDAGAILALATAAGSPYLLAYDLVLLAPATLLLLDHAGNENRFDRMASHTLWCLPLAAPVVAWVCGVQVTPFVLGAVLGILAMRTPEPERRADDVARNSCTGIARRRRRSAAVAAVARRSSEAAPPARRRRDAARSGRATRRAHRRRGTSTRTVR